MNISRIKTSLATLLAGAALSAQVFAQVSTPIVGFQKTTVPVGLSTAGFPLLNADILKTSATSVTGNSVTLSGQSNVGSLLSAGAPYYIEVYSGDLKGDRFDVDTAATISAANATVVLSSTSGNNTFPVNAIGVSLNNSSIALRQHVTLDQVRQMASPSFVGSNLAGNADQIQFYNSSTKTYESYFLRGDNTNWRRVGATTNGFNNVIIPPGVGVFVSKVSGSTEITSAGTVRQNDFANPLGSGLQLRASPFPTELSGLQFNASSTGGWTGSNLAGSADQIQYYDSATKAYVSYFLRGDGTNWRRVGATTNMPSGFQLVSGSSAFFIDRKTADANAMIANPISN